MVERVTSETQQVDYGPALRALFRVVSSLASAAAAEYPDPHLDRAEKRCRRVQAAIEAIRDELYGHLGNGAAAGDHR